MKRLLRCLGLLSLLASSGAHAEVMTWVLQDFPPIYMPQGGRPGDGINDTTVKQIVARMPGIEQQYVVANVSRIYAMLDAGEPACFLGSLRTPERERLYHLSNVQLSVPVQLIVRKAVAHQLPTDAAGRVRLAELLAQPGLRGLLVTQRSYGAAIDALIAARPERARIDMQPSGSVGGNFFKMLASERAEYTIDFDFMLAYWRQLEPGRYDDLVSMPIEGNDTMPTVSVACPRTPWGKQAIVRIDGILAELARSNGLGLISNRWYTPEAVLRYGPQMKAFNLKRQTPGSARDFD